MAGLIIPNRYISSIDSHIIFLAGPIRSAPLWQDKATQILLSKNSKITVVSPRRGVRESIASYVLEGDETKFDRQRAWEWHYLKEASVNGAIMFWLPEEEKHSCDKVYGAMTRIELGQWMTRYQYNNKIKVCFGSDGRFPEIDTIAYDLSLHSKNKGMIPTLEQTCDEALRLAYQEP